MFRMLINSAFLKWRISNLWLETTGVQLSPQFLDLNINWISTFFNNKLQLICKELYNAALKDVQRAATSSPEERQRCGQRLAAISKVQVMKQSRSWCRFRDVTFICRTDSLIISVDQSYFVTMGLWSPLQPILDQKSSIFTAAGFACGQTETPGEARDTWQKGCCGCGLLLPQSGGLSGRRIQKQFPCQDAQMMPDMCRAQLKSCSLLHIIAHVLRILQSSFFNIF